MKKYEETKECRVCADDYPGEANRGLYVPGVNRLGKQGFKEHEKVRVTIIVESMERDGEDVNEHL